MSDIFEPITPQEIKDARERAQAKGEVLSIEGAKALIIRRRLTTYLLDEVTTVEQLKPVIQELIDRML